MCEVWGVCVCCGLWAWGGMCSVVCGVGVLVLPRIRFNRHRAVRQLEVRERCFERVSSLEMAGDGGRCRGRWRERVCECSGLEWLAGVAASVLRSESYSARRGSYVRSAWSDLIGM